MIAVCAADPNACRERYGDFVEQVTEYRQELDKLSGMDLPQGLKNDVATYFLHNAEAVSMVLHTEIAADLQKRYGVSSETAIRLVAAASAVAGSIKGSKGAGEASVPAKNFSIADRVYGQLNDPRMGQLARKLDGDALQKLANNPGAARFLDARTGHINIIQEVEGKLIRITVPRDEMKIISVGPIRSNQVKNLLGKGDFVPLP